MFSIHPPLFQVPVPADVRRAAPRGGTDRQQHRPYPPRRRRVRPQSEIPREGAQTKCQVPRGAVAKGKGTERSLVN